MWTAALTWRWPTSVSTHCPSSAAGATAASMRPRPSPPAPAPSPSPPVTSTATEWWMWLWPTPTRTTCRCSSPAPAASPRPLLSDSLPRSSPCPRLWWPATSSVTANRTWLSPPRCWKAPKRTTSRPTSSTSSPAGAGEPSTLPKPMRGERIPAESRRPTSTATGGPTWPSPLREGATSTAPSRCCCRPPASTDR